MVGSVHYTPLRDPVLGGPVRRRVQDKRLQCRVPRGSRLDNEALRTHAAWFGREQGRGGWWLKDTCLV